MVSSHEEYTETVIDGLQVYHNPFARTPLNPKVFRGKGVVQHYYDHSVGEWKYEGVTGSLQFRQVFTKLVESKGVPRVIST